MPLQILWVVEPVALRYTTHGGVHMKKILLIFCMVFCPSLAAMECSVTKKESYVLSYIQYFLERGGKIDHAHKHGFTLLHSWARAGYKKACQL